MTKRTKNRPLKMRLCFSTFEARIALAADFGATMYGDMFHSLDTAPADSQFEIQDTFQQGSFEWEYSSTPSLKESVQEQVSFFRDDHVEEVDFAFDDSAFLVAEQSFDRVVFDSDMTWNRTPELFDFPSFESNHLLDEHIEFEFEADAEMLMDPGLQADFVESLDEFGREVFASDIGLEFIGDSEAFVDLPFPNESYIFDDVADSADLWQSEIDSLLFDESFLLDPTPELFFESPQVSAEVAVKSQPQFVAEITPIGDTDGIQSFANDFVVAQVELESRPAQSSSNDSASVSVFSIPPESIIANETFDESEPSSVLALNDSTIETSTPSAEVSTPNAMAPSRSSIQIADQSSQFEIDNGFVTKSEPGGRELMTSRIRDLGSQLLQYSSLIEMADNVDASLNERQSQQEHHAVDSTKPDNLTFAMVELSENSNHLNHAVSTGNDPATIVVPIRPLEDFSRFNIFEAISDRVDDSQVQLEESHSTVAGVPMWTATIVAAGTMGLIFVRRQINARNSDSPTDFQSHEHTRVDHCLEPTVRAAVRWVN